MSNKKKVVKKAEGPERPLKEKTLMKEWGELQGEELVNALVGRMGGMAADLAVMPALENAGVVKEYEVDGTTFKIVQAITGLCFMVGGRHFGVPFSTKFGSCTFGNALLGMLRNNYSINSKEDLEEYLKPAKELYDSVPEEAQAAFDAAEEFAPSELLDTTMVNKKPDPEPEPESTWKEYFPLVGTTLKVSEENASKNARHPGVQNSMDKVESVRQVLVDGLAGVDAISKDSPIECACMGCVSLIKNPDDAIASFDLVTKLGGVVCPACAIEMEQQNAAYAAHTGEGKHKLFIGHSRCSHILHTDPKELTPEQLKELRDEYYTLKDLLDTYIQVHENNQKAGNELLNEAKINLVGAKKELEDLKSAGKFDGTNVMKVAEEALAKAEGHLKVAEQLAKDHFTEADKAHASMKEAEKDMVEFSELNAPLLDRIMYGSDTEASATMLPDEEWGKTLKDIDEKIDEKKGAGTTKKVVKKVDDKEPVAVVEYKIPIDVKVKDPYPHLTGNARCECGNTEKDYKNCHGRLAFLNVKGHIAKNGKRPFDHPRAVRESWAATTVGGKIVAANKELHESLD